MTHVGDPRTVTSAGNAAVKRARALERDRTLRERQGLYLAWGLHLAQEALSTGAPVRHAFVGTRLQESQEGRNLLRDLGAAGIPILRTTTRILETVVEGIDTTLSFHLEVLADERFRKGDIHTGYLEEFLSSKKAAA